MIPFFHSTSLESPFFSLHDSPSTFSKWLDHIVIVNIYGPMPVGTWYGYTSKGMNEWNAKFARNGYRLLTVRRNSKVISIRRNVTAIDAYYGDYLQYELYSFSYDLLIPKTEMCTAESIRAKLHWAIVLSIADVIFVCIFPHELFYLSNLCKQIVFLISKN